MIPCNPSSNSNPIEDQLPLTITSIAAQKKRNDRFSLFHQDQFLIGVSSKTLIDFSIQPGTKLTPELYNNIQYAEEYQAVKESFYRYLGGRDHAAFELKQKALKKGFEDQLVLSVLEEFGKKGLLNDEVFARKFAYDKAEFKRWGPNKIQNALYEKGISKHIVEKVVQNLSDDLEQTQICVDLLHKRRKHFLREADPIKRKQKMYRYLTGKGYTGSDVSKATDLISKEFDV
jgi:regulatory protein